MVDEKKVSSNEENIDKVSIPNDDAQVKAQEMSLPTSGAVSYSSNISEIEDVEADVDPDVKIDDSQNLETGDDQETSDEVDDEEEMDDEEYERIKKELLQEYMEEEDGKENQQDVDEEEMDSGELSEEPAEMSSENSQDEINKIMGGDSTGADTNNDAPEDIQEKLDGNVIDNDQQTSDNIDLLTPDIDKGVSKVAISKKNSVTIMVLIVLFLVYVIYKMLQPDETEVKQPAFIDKNRPIVKPVQDVGQTIVVPEVPKFPQAPKQLDAPTPQAMPTPPLPPLLDVTPIAPPPPAIATSPAAPPPISGISSIGGGSEVIQELGDLDQAAADKKAQDEARKQSRLKSGIMVAGGGGGGGKKGSANNGPDLTKLARSGNQIAATYIGDLHRIIAQGKVIDAVLETAINTDLPGPIRAVVSRDVYSEAGKNILINRGSRLIGTYSADIKYGQARVQIVWERVIRPDGIDIKISSPGIDDIGRAGSAGDVDNHVMRNLSMALMMSAINITLANAADKNGGSSGGTTTSTSSTDATTGTTSSSSTSNTLSNEQQAYQDALGTVNKMTNDILGKSLNMPPTITVDQGTPLKVFVQRDVVFPGGSANLTRMID